MGLASVSPFFMPLFFDHNPDTGVYQYFDYDPITDNFSITSVQDVSLMLDQIKSKRDDQGAWKKGIKNSFAHYASIPAVVEMEMKKKGIDIYDKNATERIKQEIEQNYPYLKTTEARMWRPKTRK